MRLQSTTSALLLALFSIAGLVRAQNMSGSIAGAVRDYAAVVANHVETNSRFTTATNNDGLYWFPSLPIGTYRLEVESSGFRKYVGTGIHLHVNENLTLDVTLAVGQMTQTFEVTAEAAVNTQTAEVGRFENCLLMGGTLWL